MGNDFLKTGLAAGPMFSNTIDIHGLAVRDAVQMVGLKINRALLADVDRIRIVHDRGLNKLTRELERYLSTLRTVRSFHPDEENPSVLWVYFTTGNPPQESVHSTPRKFGWNRSRLWEQ